MYLNVLSSFLLGICFPKLMQRSKHPLQNSSCDLYPSDPECGWILTWMKCLQTIHSYSRDLCAVSRPFDLLIVLKIPRLHAKWMREMKQFVHQFGCWHSFSAINGVVSFSPEFLEKTMEGEREREKTCTRKIPKALSWQSGPGCRVFYTDVFKFVLNAFLRLTISPVPLAAFRCADLDGLTAKAPRRKSRVGERHFHHTAPEGGSRWRVSLDRGKFKFYRWKPPKKNYFQMEKLQHRRWDVLASEFSCFGWRYCQTRFIWMHDKRNFDSKTVVVVVRKRERERELFKLLTHVASFLFLVPKHKERPPEPDFDFSYEGAAASSSAGGDAQPWQNNR